MTTDLFEAAQANICVLLTGCTCARTVAFRIHDLSSHHAERFVEVDCSGTEQELEEQLFQRLTGFEQPRVSTLFVEEVGKLSLAQQRRLVEAIDRPMNDGSFGGTRVIACASESLIDRVIAGTFDDRLFYRLNSIHLHLYEPDRAAPRGPSYSARSATIGSTLAARRAGSSAATKATAISSDCAIVTDKPSNGGTS